MSLEIFHALYIKVVYNNDIKFYQNNVPIKFNCLMLSAATARDAADAAVAIGKICRGGEN